MQASASAARAYGLIIGVAVLGIVLLLSGIRRIRRNLEPGQDQAEFADTLQIASDEDEAQQLLQRHLERTLAATAAVVLNRNNSADRLEAVTPLPGSSPLAETLRGAKPRSCLAVRSGRTHRQDAGQPGPARVPGLRPVPRRCSLFSAHGRRRGDRLCLAQPPGPLWGGRGTANPGIRRPGGSRPGQKEREREKKKKKKPTGTLPAATAGRNSRSSSPTPRSQRPYEIAERVRAAVAGITLPGHRRVRHGLHRRGRLPGSRHHAAPA